MKKLFAIALFFWACTFTQQAQMKKTGMHPGHSQFNKGNQFSSQTLTDSYTAMGQVISESTCI